MALVNWRRQSGRVLLGQCGKDHFKVQWRVSRRATVHFDLFRLEPAASRGIGTFKTVEEAKEEAERHLTAPLHRLAALGGQL